jgi:hypothetical protein
VLPEVSKRTNWAAALIILALALLAAGLVMRARFERDLALAFERSTLGSTLADTPCGPIE